MVIFYVFIISIYGMLYYCQVCHLYCLSNTMLELLFSSSVMHLYSFIFMNVIFIMMFKTHIQNKWSALWTGFLSSFQNKTTGRL